MCQPYQWTVLSRVGCSSERNWVRGWIIGKCIKCEQYCFGHNTVYINIYRWVKKNQNSSRAFCFRVYELNTGKWKRTFCGKTFFKSPKLHMTGDLLCALWGDGKYSIVHHDTSIYLRHKRSLWLCLSWKGPLGCIMFPRRWEKSYTSGGRTKTSVPIWGQHDNRSIWHDRTFLTFKTVLSNVTWLLWDRGYYFLRLWKDGLWEAGAEIPYGSSL